MHPVIGLAILIGTATFVVFAFRQGMRVRPDRRTDNIPARAMGSDIGPSQHSGGGFGQG